jgi:hypothetical protein
MRNRANIATAIALIAAGTWFLAAEIYQPVRDIAYGAGTWPFNVIAIGLLLGVIGLGFWIPGLMIPASIVGGIGGLLYWQNATGNFASWAYAWALIPGFVAIGIFIQGLMARDRGSLKGSVWLLLISMTMFLIFGSFLGGGRLIWQFWPVLLIVFGIILLTRGLFRKR